MTLLLTLDDGSVQRKLAEAVEFARAAVLEDAPEEQLGAHVGVTREDAVTASHLFEAQVPGYGGWRWSVTVAAAGEDEPVTVSEVVLVPGPSALVAPAWVPWERRVRAGDLGVGDIFPTAENDPRLVPAYLQSDDPAVEEVAHEAGLGRVHALSRLGRTEAAARWHGGEFGPRSDMARSAPDVCGTCGFFVPLAGSLRGVFGVCGNDIAPADGHVVDVEYGCGAHSEVEVEVTSSVPVAELVYDDSLLDFTPALSPEVVETAAAEPETVAAEPETAQVELPASPVAAGEVAEPGEAGEAPEPMAAEAADLAGAAGGPVDAVAEPAHEVSGEVAEPVATPEAPAAAEPVAAPTATEEVAEASVAGEVEPAASEALVVTDVVAEPVVAEVPEPAEAEPTQAEVTDAAEVRAEPHQAATEPEPGEIPVATEPDAAEVDPVPAEVTEVAETEAPEGAEPTLAEAADGAAEPQAAAAPEPADAEPTQAEVTDAVAEADAGGDPQDSEVPPAVLTDNVVTEASPADEAHVQVDDTPER
ncbi:DUF3027 domain-containing protein [Amycolatopsis mediterranei]|uniref:DUF3027 domain-containing protein n=1 Tax=Amycolatopsis mediterranei TaxID=33910 RepID=UPI00344AE36B